MTLRQKQSLFVSLVAELIREAYRRGYELTFAEAYRPPETAALYATQRRGIPNSLHCIRLAVDLNLFRNGKYLSSTESHRPLGEYWESLHPWCVWGGRFGDGNHYSLTHGGAQ